MARRARLASRDPGLVVADGRAGTADRQQTRLGLADRRTPPVAAWLVLRGLKAGRHAVPTWPRPGGVRSVARVTAKPSGGGASCGVRRQGRPRLSPEPACWRPGEAMPGRPDRPPALAACAARCRPRRHPSATPSAETVTGTAGGTNPTEPGRHPLRGRSALALPSSPARGRPRPRSAPGWAHRFGSSVPPIKTPVPRSPS